MEAKTIRDIEAEDGIKHDPYFEASKIPEIVRKENIGYSVREYWVDTVIPGLTGEWFEISRKGNKIIIQPVIISYPQGREF